MNANVAYVATLENIVYAIDIDRRDVCWQTPPLGSPEGAAGLLGLDPQVEGGVRAGIVSTPVIDLAKSVMYVVTRVWDSSGLQTHFLLNVLDTRTGVLIARVEVPPSGGGRTFIAGNHNNRPGLLLVANKVFVAFGSTRGEDDAVDYHGFVFGFDVTDPGRPTAMSGAFCATPTTVGGGIWMSGGGLASDGSSVYFATGNGAYHVVGDIVNPDLTIPDTPRPGEHPDSFVKLDSADLSVRAAYTDLRRAGEIGLPYRFGSSTHTLFWARERSDADLGSGGVLLLGNRLIGGGKDGRLDVLETSSLHFVQSFLAFFDADNDGATSFDYYHTYSYNRQWYDGPNIHGGPVALPGPPGSPYINVYAWSEKDYLKRFRFVPAQGMFLAADVRDATPSNPAPTAHGSVKSAYRSMPGGMLSISANGSANGIVWAVVEEPYPRSRAFHERCLGASKGNLTDCAGCYLSNGAFAEYCDATRGYVAGRLYAFAADADATASLRLLWGDKRSVSPNNLIPRYSKFTPPTIAHGKVILATGNDEVRIYGLGACGLPCSRVMRRRDDLVAAWNDGGSATFALYPSTRQAFETHTAWKVREGGWDDSIKWLSGDFDGDGSSDIVAIWNDAGFNTLTVRLREGKPPRSQEHWLQKRGSWDRSAKWVAGDFDGDGLTDIASISNDFGFATITVYRSAGTHFEEPFVWARRDGGWGDSISWVAGDFNGDGLADIVATWDNGGANTLTVRLSTGSSFLTQQHWAIKAGGWAASTKWLAGDFDGDGFTDIAAAWNDAGAATIAVYLSTGVDFAHWTQWKIRDGGWGDDVKWVAGDFNSDGLSDLAAIWDDNGANTLTVRQSTGSSFITSHWDIRDGGWMSSTAWCAGKFR
ncbi:MAG TPA: VCBS repeat-containing protein [Thermoanaerobaculia bacterium]|nr:VCBS repeat-containing protein [Thermoanaerobaculia bacterium]